MSNSCGQADVTLSGRDFQDDVRETELAWNGMKQHDYTHAEHYSPNNGQCSDVLYHSKGVGLFENLTIDLAFQKLMRLQANAS